MNIVAIVQARMGSTRLPGKVLLDIAGRSMLARVIRRARRAELLAEVVVATGESAEDDPIVQECRRLAVPYFRGSDEDVLKRYHGAALAYRAEAVVRITSDCPLIDPGVVDRVVHEFLEREPDYASNILDRTWPRGLDTEIMTAGTLDRAFNEADLPYERTHVTPYIYGHPELFDLFAVTQPQDLSDGRWTVDSPDDMEFIRVVYDRFGGDDRIGWRDVYGLLASDPPLAQMNRHVRQKAVVEG
jgi:spore coat polysaccharide biosynthesis protein SpsF